MDWNLEVLNLLDNNEYDLIVRWYESRIESEPDNLDNYWYLGLSYLLIHEEELAQTTWLLALGEAEEEEVEKWTRNLILILDAEAERQKKRQNYRTSWLIRGHIRELVPYNLSNLLSYAELDISLNGFNANTFIGEEIINLLESTSIDYLVHERILQLLATVSLNVHPQILSFVESWLPYVNPEDFVLTIMPITVTPHIQYKNTNWGISLIDLCLRVQPNSLYLRNNLYVFHSLNGDFNNSLSVAHEFESLAQNTIQKIFGKYLIINTLKKAGMWNDLSILIDELKKLILSFNESEDKTIKEDFIKANLLSIPFPLRYYQDSIGNNQIQVSLSKIFQEQLPVARDIHIDRDYYLNEQPGQKLKIGYVASTLKRHSVGWLSRWLIHYHDRSRFDIFIYLINQENDDITACWFQKPGDKTYNFYTIADTVAQIQSDRIHILVDLDSITSYITCQIMALKPAPIGVTWLGYDASGIPAVDYFIADNYALPENAQDYYQEKIWRLSDSFVSVDGFEVGIPTITRRDLGIPHNAVIYLSAQTAAKRHPDTIHLQMRILARVPDSYLLVKGLGDSEIIQRLFYEIADAEGVSTDRLRFLPIEATEEIHRANLMIADVVLDTYPYGGATTSLEVLWMGIPLVSRVGQQFAARNTYSFMVNAGLEEGIAWSDGEYVGWGIKFGTDEALRRRVVEKLRLSRQIAPLWKGEEFTREMEDAYRQMWVNYRQEYST